VRYVRSCFAAQRGQTLIEFALIAPLVFLFLFVIVDFGIALDRRIVLQHAVREGARYAAVHTDADDIRQRTVGQAQDIIVLADVEVCYIDGDDSNSTVGDPGDSVRVSAHLTYDLAIVRPVLTGLFGGTSAGTIDMIPSATARLERTVNGATPCP
jgi:hypothetical protein